MKLGKSKWVVSFALAGGLLCSSYNVSYADDTDKVIQTESSGDPSILCRKGDASKKIFSLRSFNGNLCKLKHMAAFAVMLCRGKGCASNGKDCFNGSSCDKNAKNVLGKDYDDPKAFLIQQVKTGAGKIKTLVCSQSGRLPPNLQDVANKACPGAPGQSTTPAETPSD